MVAREKWPPGPWDSEPDDLRWRDDSTGLPCLALRPVWVDATDELVE
jgi:hypothetical protein